MRHLILWIFISSLSASAFCQTNTFPTSGKVGVGTISPTALLTLNTGTTRDGLTIVSGYTGTSGMADIILKSASNLGFSASLASQWHMSLRNDGYFSNSAINTGLSLEFYAIKTSGGYYAPLSFTSDGNVILASNKGATSGNVVIGTTTNSIGDKLLVSTGNQNFRVFTNGAGITDAGWRNTLVFSNNYSYHEIYNNSGGPLVLQSSNGGNVLIGKASQANTSYRLDVNGNIRSNKLIVNASGADFVFDSTYRLRPLALVESYISKHHHLPEMPSAVTMQKNGLDIGLNQEKLLQKIEELTLYIIDQEKELVARKETAAKLEKRVDMQGQQIKDQDRQIANQNIRIAAIEALIKKIATKKEAAAIKSY